MTTETVTLVHPKRKDTKTVSTAAARIHRRAGWITQAEADQIESLPDNAKDLVDWIGDDVDKAATALLAEQARPKPRSTVLDHIEAVTTNPDTSEED